MLSPETRTEVLQRKTPEFSFKGPRLENLSQLQDIKMSILALTGSAICQFPEELLRGLGDPLASTCSRSYVRACKQAWDVTALIKFLDGGRTKGWGYDQHGSSLKICEGHGGTHL
jgi:hypothetical protein